MKLKNYYALLTAAAVCSVAFALFADSSSLLISLLRFPFGPIGNGLRIMSLAAEAENILAWMIFVMLSAIPAAVWLFMRKRSEAKCDILLPVLSPVLAVVLYNCINPFGSFLTAVAGPEMLQAQYGAVVYVILVSWLVLRTVHAFRTADESVLYKASGIFLKLLGVLFVITAFGSCFGDLLNKIEAIRSANQNSGSLTLTFVFLALHCITDALPPLLNTAAVIMALKLLNAFTEDSEHTAAYAEQLAKWCGTTLTVTAIVTTVFHVLQMLCLPHLRNLDVSVSLPVGSVTFLLVCLIAARIIEENKALKADNDLFI